MLYSAYRKRDSDKLKGKVFDMAGTRTAPDVTGAATFKLVSFRWIDASGTRRSDSYQVPAAATAAQIDDAADAAQALSNASLWAIDIGSVYAGDMDTGAAESLVYAGNDDNVVILLKQPDNQARDFFVPAPIEALFIEETENIDQSNAELATLETALEALFAGTYTIRGNRFTHRSQRGKFNPK